MRERWFAWLMTQASRWHEPLVAERKRALMAGLRGDVLEIGAGAGGNLRYLHPEVKWTGYEPNRRLAARIASGNVIAREFERDARLYDAVIATLVLCSVNDCVPDSERKFLELGQKPDHPFNAGAPDRSDAIPCRAHAIDDRLPDRLCTGFEPLP